jgi:hypothetical protein
VSNSLQRIQIQLARENAGNHQPFADGIARARQAFQADETLREAKLVPSRSNIEMDIEEDMMEQEIAEKKSSSAKSTSRRSAKETAPKPTKAATKATTTGGRKSSRSTKVCDYIKFLSSDILNCFLVTEHQVVCRI